MSERSAVLGAPMTRVGVLECDHIDPRFRPIAGDVIDMLRTLFRRHAPDAGLELVTYDVVGGAPLPRDPAECDAWLCPGSRHGVADGLPWVDDLAGFVRRIAEAGAPFVGVCFGHQLLAHALGGRVARAPSGWGAGIERIAVDGDAPWMVPPAAKLALHFMHQDQIVEIPPGAEVLGRSDHCPVALLAVGDRMVGVQAHPEYTAPYADALLVDRVDRIGAEEVAAARAGLSQTTDEATMAAWMVRVLTAV